MQTLAAPPVKIIRNIQSGQEYKLLRTGKETGGEALEMEVFYPAHSARPPEHYHPHQTEFFKVLSGEMMVLLNGQSRMYKTGETFEVPPNTVHAMWNEQDQPTVMQWLVTPAMKTEQLFETMAGLAYDGKTSRKGAPKLLQTALTMLYFSREYRLAKPPFLLLLPVFALLAPVAYLLGYKPLYKKYLS